MSRRRTPSPYPHPPSEFARRMMRAGWRRCDAEHVDVVRRALAHAHDPTAASTWAQRAADSLDRGPVLAGAIRYLAGQRGAATAAWRLSAATPPRRGFALLAFAQAAIDRSTIDVLRRALETVADDDEGGELGAQARAAEDDELDELAG